MTNATNTTTLRPGIPGVISSPTGIANAAASVTTPRMPAQEMTNGPRQGSAGPARRTFGSTRGR